jgi:putative serine protease PepD
MPTLDSEAFRTSSAITALSGGGRHSAPPHSYREDHGATTDADGASSADQKPRKSSRTAALLFAGLAVAAISGGIGATTALAVQNRHSALPTIATAEAAASQTVRPNSGSVEEVAAKVVPSVVQLETDAGSEADEGSGIILTTDGLIMTNNHVVSAAGNAGPANTGGPRTTVTLADGRTAPFAVVATDPTSDIAIVRAQGISGLTPIALGSSSNLRVGQQVVAVGCPLGLQGTVTTGVISALHRPVSSATDSANKPIPLDAIQTDAPMNPGNSGGALVDMNGQLIGMPSAIATLGTSSGSSGSIGLGFAIPVDQAKRVVDQLEHRPLQSPLVGHAR